jgi:SAM-dependent methyltransferase
LEKAEYRKHFELEESFWWFRGRRKVLLSLLRSRPMSARPLVWLDAGCGTGFNMTVFSSFGSVVGCDFSEDALAFCRQRGLRKLLRADVQRLPCKAEVFDAVSFLDVLYHKKIRDDRTALNEARAALKPGGLLLIADSAFNVLRSPHDLAVHGRERYRKKTLRPRLEAAGFDVLRMSYFNFFLFPVIFIVRWAERSRGGKKETAESDLKVVPAIVNSVLSGILKFEALLLKRVDLPWGSSIVCLARKR